MRSSMVLASFGCMVLLLIGMADFGFMVHLRRMVLLSRMVLALVLIGRLSVAMFASM